MTEKVRAAIYARISLDSAGEELGVTRQLDLARDLIGKRDGWVEVGLYADNSISALRGKRRPQYAALMEAIERDEIDVVVVYQLSRLWRNRRERAEGIEVLMNARVSIVSVRGSDLDLSTAYGRTMAGVLGEFDTMESEVKSERVRDHKQQHAESGRYHGGGTRPFGYALDYDRPAVNPMSGQRQPRRVVAVRIDETEAEIIREGARRVLAGESLRSVAGDFNARGFTTATGKGWRPEGLRRILCSALISGRREVIHRDSHRGKVRPVVGEIVADGTWPAIITTDESDRLRATLSNPARRKSPVEARKTMLTGILVCGKCGTPMVSRPRQGVPRYSCVSDPGRPGCGRTVVDGARSDAEIAAQILGKLDQSPDLIERLHRRDGTDPDLIERVRADEQRLEELAADYAAGDITRPEWKAAREIIAARVDTARARMARSTHTSALDGFVGPFDEMQSRWDQMNPSQRRAVVAAVVEKITVNPPSVSGRFDPDRFVPVWRA